MNILTSFMYSHDASVAFIGHETGKEAFDHFIVNTLFPQGIQSASSKPIL